MDDMNPHSETVQRWDAGRLRKAHRTDEGFLFADGFATRTGVLTYHLPDGSTRRELRHPDEVGHADSLASLGRKPVTLGHPPKMVDPENAEAHQVGTVGEQVTFNKADGFVRVTMALHRQDAIEAVERGTRELSAGYRVTLVHEPGTFEGEAFDARQTQIRYNHLSIEGQGRAGPSVRLRLDGAGIEVQPVRENQMSERASVKIGDVRYDADPGLAQAVTTALQAERQDAEAHKARADQAETELGTVKAQLETVTGERDGLQTKLDSQPTETPEARLDWFNERTGLVATAKAHGLEEGLETMDNAAIKRSVVRTVREDLKEDASPEYVQGLYDAITSKPASRSDVDDVARRFNPGGGETRTDYATALKEAEADMMKSYNTAQAGQ